MQPRKIPRRPMASNMTSRLGGGDQIYQDGVRVSGPLREWTDIKDPVRRAKYPFPESLRKGCDEYYCNNYIRWYVPRARVTASDATRATPDNLHAGWSATTGITRRLSPLRMVVYPSSISGTITMLVKPPTRRASLRRVPCSWLGLPRNHAPSPLTPARPWPQPLTLKDYRWLWQLCGRIYEIRRL